MGAILAGATVGDSLSPVSDTTIASAGTQRMDIGGTVRARLPYAATAGTVALVAAWALVGASALGLPGAPALLSLVLFLFLSTLLEPLFLQL
jgi:Na+/H+ antiporter NhaC